MKIVYKYPIEFDGHFTLMLPRGANILSVQMQGSIPCIWALVDPDEPEAARTFKLYGTGHPIAAPDTLQFVGTFQVDEGMFVFHLFEVITPETWPQR
jgi:hypothetical protein